jgi:pyruvate formate lyase activating enzyme
MRDRFASGEDRPIAELVAEVARDARYWERGGGGVTLSGGEPLLQADAAAAFLHGLVEEGYHTCIETSGAGDTDSLIRLDAATSLWLFDVKTADADRFHQATGGDLDLVLANLVWLLQHRPESTRIRIPLINGFSAQQDCLDAIADVLRVLPSPARVELLPGHSVGVACKRDPSVTAELCSRAAARLQTALPNVEVRW